MIEDLAGRLTPEQFQFQMEQALRPVLALIAGASDYSEAMTQLAALYPDMNTGDLQAVLSRGVFLCECIGRNGAQEEANQEETNGEADG